MGIGRGLGQRGGTVLLVGGLTLTLLAGCGGTTDRSLSPGAADETTEPPEDGLGVARCGPRSAITRTESLISDVAPGLATVEEAVRAQISYARIPPLPDPTDEATTSRGGTSEPGYRVAMMPEGSDGRLFEEGREAVVSYRGPSQVEAFFHVVELPKGGWVVDVFEYCPPAIDTYVLRTIETHDLHTIDAAF